MDGDKISTLPTNNNDKLQEQEQHLLDLILEDKKEQIKEVKQVSLAFKESILGGLLFLILSHPLFDKIIRSTGCNSELTILLLKFVIFTVLYFILQNKFLNVKKM